MIWIDSSFAVEWLLGTERAKPLLGQRPDTWGILDNQYCEVLTFFLKRGVDVARVEHQLEGLLLLRADKPDLVLASSLYVRARAAGSKASLPDAILAAKVSNNKSSLLSFDQDFASLGLLSEDRVLWTIA